MDPELNYINYFTEIERFFQCKRESFTLLSTLDWVLIENWKEQNLPLEIVLKGIDRAFSNPKRKRKINSLAYCAKAIDEVRDEHKETRVETPEFSDLEERDLKDYVEKIAAEVARVDESLAASVRATDLSSLKAAETTLNGLEEKLIAKLKVMTDDSAMVDLKRELDAEMAPFRSTMTTPQLLMIEQQMWRRKLLEKFNLPRLSLFYLL